MKPEIKIKPKEVTLTTELAYFQTLKAELIAKGNEGRWALICKEELKGCFDTWRDALQIGYATYGLQPFLTKKVEAVETAKGAHWVSKSGLDASDHGFNQRELDLERAA